MPARQKLNAAALNGGLIVAGVIGIATHSWAAFLGFAFLFSLLGLHSGDIRPWKRLTKRK